MMEHILTVLVPLTIANILHMVVVKNNFFPALQIPLSVSYFGANKTLRGFVVLPLLNTVILSALAVFFEFLLFRNTFLTGLLLGLSYLIAELPNSYFKRRSGIAPGESPEKNRLFFTLLDKSDSALGVTLTYAVISGIAFFPALLLFLCCSCTHLGFSWVLHQIKLKRSF